MIIYRTLNGILYSTKFKIDDRTGSFLIMNMHMIVNYTDHKCIHLRFTIFDYVTRKFIYWGIYNELEYHREFNGHALLKLCEPSLRLIYFEEAPFTEHIGIV